MSQNHRGRGYCQDPLAGTPFPTESQNLLVFENIEALRDYSTGRTAVGQYAVVEGYYERGDGGGGEFFFERYPTEADNGGTFISANNGVGQWVRIVTGGVLHAKWFGVIGNGLSNDTAVLQSALNALESGGSLDIGGLSIRTTAVNVPSGVSIIGSMINPDPRDADLLISFADTILLDGTAATVTLHETSALNGLKVLRYGMTFPQNAAAVAAWAGTAITLAAGAHAATISNCAIVGFEFGVDMDDASFTEQTRMFNVAIDCLNGVRLVSGTDRITLNGVECWPTASVGLSSPTDADLQRPGIAFDLDAAFGIDAPNLSNCFAYAYATGFHFGSVNGATLVNCVTDYTVTKSDSITGYSVDGDSSFTAFIGCKAYRSTNGIIFDPNQAIHYLSVMGCSFEFIEESCIYLLEGSGAIYTSFFSNAVGTTTDYGINAHDCTGSSRFIIDGNNFNSMVNGYAETGTTPGNVLVPGQNSATGNGTNTFSGGGLATYASASTVSVPAAESAFFVSGNVGIDNFNTTFAFAGREITVIFTGSPTVVNSAGLNLAGAANFVASPNDVLTLIWGGSAWFEKSRSVN